MRKEPTFPDVDIVNHQSEFWYFCKIETNIRIKHTDGKYYLTKAIKGNRGEIKEIESVKNTLFNTFIHEVYFAQQLMIVDPDMEVQDIHGPVKLFKLDPDQTDEKERLRNMLKF